MKPVVVMMLLLATGAAAAQEQESPALAEARARFELAEQHYQRQEYASAMEEFERSYQLLASINHPRRHLILWNLGQTAMSMSRERQALEHYRRYLAEAPADAPNRAEAQSLVRELELRGQMDGSPGGQSLSPVGPIVLGVGGAAAITGVILGGLALAQHGEATARCTGIECPRDALAQMDGAATLANVSDGLLWGGLAVAAAGVVLTLVLRDGAPAATAACTGEGCVVMLAGRL
ncbi:MAG: hypothetical protein IT378_03805 [Sandaracinaceae bacterium]|nr:hypothetical protein [Sandaracinaceae bacterium]